MYIPTLPGGLSIPYLRDGERLEARLPGPHSAVADDVVIGGAGLQAWQHDVRDQRRKVTAGEERQGGQMRGVERGRGGETRASEETGVDGGGGA